MKLQKLVYFAHGLHLAMFGVPLIEEEFQAWKYGPVVRDIYNTYRFYGSSPISNTDWLFFEDALQKKIERLDSNAIKSINTTWTMLKDFKAGQLSNWSHKAGSPWERAYKEGEADIIIQNSDIQDYFKQFVKG